MTNDDQGKDNTGARAVKLDHAFGVWLQGEPPKPWRDEWFIAKTIHGGKVVLRALPEEWTYDYTTADHTYMIAANIVCWMQFPDSEYIAPPLPDPCAIAALVMALEMWRTLDAKDRLEDNGDFAVELEAARKATDTALARLGGGELMRCAECDCQNGGTDCNWIKSEGKE